MKTLYTIIFFLLVSASSIAQTYYVYTATKSGSWNDMSVWSIGVRTDGVHKTKVIITAPYIISVDNAVNSFGLGDVEINIMGSLSLLPSTTIALSSPSSIQLFGSGSIVGTNSTQKITIGSITKYNGSLDFTKSGASIASAASGVSPSGFISLSVLPVVFSSYTAVKHDGDVVLTWSTASETKNSHFDIERSYNGSTWTVISTLHTTGAAASYSYTDKNVVSALVYYRLKQVDENGAFTYSTLKTIRGNSAVAAKIYGANKILTIELNTDVNKAVTVTVMTTNGQVLQQKQFNTGYKINLNLTGSAAGIVIVHIADNNTLNQTQKLFL